MPNVTGQNFSTTDPLKPSPGSSVDAGIRVHREVFNTTTHLLSGTVNGAIAARVREGNTVLKVRMKSDANLSAINFTVGNATVLAKYCGAQAGGAADTMKEFEVKINALDDDPLAVPEEIIITPSGNWPAGATVVTFVEVCKR